MCYYYRIPGKEQLLKERMASSPLPPDLPPEETVLTGFDLPAAPITTAPFPSLRMAYWGLIPSWATNKKIALKTLNAKIETLTEKPSFKDLTQNRCLVWATGFYEWQWLDRKGKQKQKYLITLKDQPLFAFAGLFSTGETHKTFTILTTAANEVMAKIHNTKKRMPVLLPREKQSDWLEGAPIDSFKTPSLSLKTEKIYPANVEVLSLF